MPQLDISLWPPQLVWLAISFALLYFIVSRIIIPRTGGVILQRKTHIAADLASAEKDKVDSQNALKSYEASLAAARAKAADVSIIARTKLNTETDAARTKIDAELAAKSVDSDKMIALSKSKALANIDEVAADIAAMIVDLLTGEKVAKTALVAAIAKAGK